MPPRIALVTCSWFADLDDDDLPLRDALLQRGAEVKPAVWNDPAVDWGRFDAAVIRSPWDYDENVPGFNAWLDGAAAETRLLNSRELVSWNLLKWYLDELAGHGVRTIPTEFVEGPDDLEYVSIRSILEKRGWEAIVVKPMIDLGGRQAHRFEVPSEVDAAQEHLMKIIDKGGMVQPLLGRVAEEGETSLIYIDGELSHAVRKLPGPGEFRIHDLYGGRVEGHEATPEEVQVGDAVVAHLSGADAVWIDRRRQAPEPEPPVYARVDLLPSDDGPRLIELELIEPRLFLRLAPAAAAERLAGAILDRCA